MIFVLKGLAVCFIAGFSWFLLCPKYEYIQTGDHSSRIEYGLPAAERAKQIAKIMADYAANPHPYIVWGSSLHFPYECRLLDFIPYEYRMREIVSGEDRDRLLRLFNPFPIQLILPLNVFAAVFLTGPLMRIVRGREKTIGIALAVLDITLSLWSYWGANPASRPFFLNLDGYPEHFSLLVQLNVIYRSFLHLPGVREFLFFQPVIIGTLVYVFWEKIKIRQISRLDGNNHTDRY